MYLYMFFQELSYTQVSLDTITVHSFDVRLNNSIQWTGNQWKKHILYHFHNLPDQLMVIIMNALEVEIFQWRQKKEMVKQEPSSGMVEFFKNITLGAQFSKLSKVNYIQWLKSNLKCKRAKITCDVY